MSKGYKALSCFSGLFLIAGFLLPWSGTLPFNLSGFTIANSGYSFLFLIPLSGAVSLLLLLAGKKQQIFFNLYPGMAGMLSLVCLISVTLMSDSGIIQLGYPLSFSKLFQVTYNTEIFYFNPLSGPGFGLLMTLAGMAGLCILPVIFRKDLAGSPIPGDSYKTIVNPSSFSEAYKKAAFLFMTLCILILTWIFCDISPVRVWENRGNAKDYLFGRALSQTDMDYINSRIERAPAIEATGRAEAFMANKYREIPFSEQPGYEEKAKERKLKKEEFLNAMTEKEKKQLRKEAEKTARTEKKGGYFPPETSPGKIKGYLKALLETIAIAIWGTLLAIICSVPVSFFAAGNTLSLIISSDTRKAEALRNGISFFVRRFLDACRGFNEFVMALIFVAVIGLGPFAGILALWIHTFGILGKVFSEQIESIEKGQMEALVSTGAGPAQTIAFSVMPQVMPGFVSYTLLRFESNVRSAAVLGFVGAGGIGFLIFDKLNGYLFPEVCTMMIIIIITVGIIDHLCSKIRMKFI